MTESELKKGVLESCEIYADQAGKPKKLTGKEKWLKVSAILNRLEHCDWRSEPTKIIKELKEIQEMK